MKPIFHYVFHFNPYTKQWACVDREFYNQYLNGEAPNEAIVYAKSFETLLTQFPDDPTQNSSQEEES